MTRSTAYVVLVEYRCRSIGCRVAVEVTVGLQSESSGSRFGAQTSIGPSEFFV